MCSVIVLYRPGHNWPLLWASNRDEMADRPWSPPARHWPDRTEVVAGRDELAGGTWLGINEAGVVAGVLNRRNTLGPQPGKRSRGELVLDALDFADAADAVAMLNEPRWKDAKAPDPDTGDWSAWQELLCDRGHDPAGTVFDAMSIVSNTGFGTVSSSLIALPAPQFATRRPVWKFIGGRPDKASIWQDIEV
jgi:hypothetical protein